MKIEKESQQRDPLEVVFKKRRKVGKYRKMAKETIKMLQDVFEQKPYPAKLELQKLAAEIGESEMKVRNWFKGQRKKDFITNKKVIKHYKHNTVFSKEQRTVLEDAFRKEHKAVPEQIEELEKALNCPKKTIQNWFYYRNCKLKRVLTAEKTRKTQYLRKSKNSSSQNNSSEDNSEEKSKSFQNQVTNDSSNILNQPTFEGDPYSKILKSYQKHEIGDSEASEFNQNENFEKSFQLQNKNYNQENSNSRKEESSFGKDESNSRKESNSNFGNGSKSGKESGNTNGYSAPNQVSSNGNSNSNNANRQNIENPSSKSFQHPNGSNLMSFPTNSGFCNLNNNNFNNNNGSINNSFIGGNSMPQLLIPSNMMHLYSPNQTSFTSSGSSFLQSIPNCPNMTPQKINASPVFIPTPPQLIFQGMAPNPTHYPTPNISTFSSFFPQNINLFYQDFQNGNNLTTCGSRLLDLIPQHIVNLGTTIEKNGNLYLAIPMKTLLQTPYVNHN